MTTASNLYDAVIVGGGPAGLTAALYLARARYRVLVIEKDHFGGQITITSEVVNYPGVFSTSGEALTSTMQQQAEAFGAEFRLAEVTGFDLSHDVKVVHTTKGDISCFAVLIATGASPRELGFEGEQEFKGHGVAYCATCDGEFFTGKDVYVVGGGFAAAEESVFLTKYARHVHVLVREEDFTCAAATAEPTKKHPKITVHYQTQLESVAGDSAIRTLTYTNLTTGEKTAVSADPGDSLGVFVFVGYSPATDVVKDIIELDPRGYIPTNEQHMTSAEGIFAAGDVCVKELRQVATAIGEAASCATNIERYVKAAQEKTGLVPEAPQMTRVKEASTPTSSEATQTSGASSSTAASESVFDEAMRQQLNAVFGRMERALKLNVYLDERPVSDDLKGYMTELASITDKLELEIHEAGSIDTSVAGDTTLLPYVEVCDTQNNALGLAFHGVPGGHEFTSFVLGLYNAAGPGQPIDAADKEAIAKLDKPLELKVIVGLSCTMCPDVVVAAQRIAADNKLVKAHVFDVNHFGDLKDRYDVMSVPCLVARYADGSEQVSFGKKSLADILAICSKTQA